MRFVWSVSGGHPCSIWHEGRLAFALCLAFGLLLLFCTLHDWRVKRGRDAAGGFPSLEERPQKAQAGKTPAPPMDPHPAILHCGQKWSFSQTLFTGRGGGRKHCFHEGCYSLGKPWVWRGCVYSWVTLACDSGEMRQLPPTQRVSSGVPESSLCSWKSSWWVSLPPDSCPSSTTYILFQGAHQAARLALSKISRGWSF